MGYLVLLICFELILFFMAFVLSGKDIMAPSVIICIMFLISSIFALVMAPEWEIKYSFESCILISSGLLVFMLTEVLFRFWFCGQLRGSNKVFHQCELKEYNIDAWKLVGVIIFDCIVCFLFFQNIVKSVGGNMTDITSYFIAYRRLGISSLKYQGTSMTTGLINSLLRIVTASGYIANYILVNNFIAKCKNRSKQFSLLVIIIISTAPSIMTGGRSGILKILSATLIIYYILWHQKNGWTRNLSWKYIRIGVLGLTIGVPLFYYSLNLLGRSTDKTILDYVSAYLGSSIELFNQYVKSPVECNSFGEESLVGIKKILNLIGVGNTSGSYNLEFRTLGDTYSNVYTFFRRPLHDFGLVGMFIFTALVACFFSWMYFKKIKYRPRDQTVAWVLLYGYIYYWLICSSIDQYSQNYISAGTVIIVLLIIIGFKILTKKF